MSRHKSGIVKEIKDKDLKESLITLCENIKRFREESGISQQDLADYSELGKSTISEIEQMRVVNVSLKTLVMISRGLEKPLTALLIK